MLRKKNKVGGITVLDFRQYFRAAVIKTIWYWLKIRCKDQWNRIKTPEINPNPYSYLIFHRKGNNILWRKDSFFM